MLRSEVLSIRPFRDLWLGQAISQVGDAFYYASFMFMVEHITGSKAMVGYVGAMEALPFLLFSPYAGVVADRVDRRKIMLLSDIVSALTLCMLAGVLLLQAQPPVWLLFVTAFTLSTVRSFFMPAKSAAIPAIVPPDMVMKANTFSMTTQNVMPLIGLAFAAGVMGILFAASPRWFFLATAVINAASFFVSAFFIARMPKVVPDRSNAHEVHPLTDLKEGIRYMASRHILMVLLLLSLFMNLMISPFFVVFVAANKTWFGGLPSTLAWFEFAFFLGMIIGSAAVAKLNVRRAGQGYIWGLAAVGGGVACMAFSRSIPLFVFWNFVCGLALPFAQIPTSNYIQMTVPDAYRGRVNSTLLMVSMGMQPIGMGLGGLVAERVGLFNAFLVMGIGMGVIALAGLLDRPFRESKMPDQAPEEQDMQLTEQAC
jgi:MFS transporter, DHA3 family, macrolide efflux protein